MGTVYRATLLAALVAILASRSAISLAADLPPPKPTDAAGWSALTLADLDAMHALLRDQTLIPYDSENPAYARWLEEGHAAARSRAAEVSNEAGYIYTLTAYANGFRDPHIVVKGRLPSPDRWPGFIAAARGDTVVVVQRDNLDPSAPALGARIESCDGQSLTELIQARMTPFFHSAGLPERWIIPRLFLDNHNPFAPLPARCSVRTGETVADITLRWRAIFSVSPNFRDEFTNAGPGPAAAWGLTEPAPGVFWIGVPTFLQSAETAPKLRALIAAINARGDEMRRARAIVIDTRGNGGGTTYWPRQLADAVFTPKVLKSARAATPVRRIAMEIRATPENAAARRRSHELLASEWTPKQIRSSLSNIKTIERAIDRKPPILRVGRKKVSPSGGVTLQRPEGGASPFPARVYFLSNGSCGSTCLEFADDVLRVPGVRLIGSATAGDTAYTEVRGEMLPSGLSELNFPQWVVRGKGRAALEKYAPDVAYDGGWDDASVRAWTLALIEAGR